MQSKILDYLNTAVCESAACKNGYAKAKLTITPLARKGDEFYYENEQDLLFFVWGIAIRQPSIGWKAAVSVLDQLITEDIDEAVKDAVNAMVLDSSPIMLEMHLEILKKTRSYTNSRRNKYLNQMALSLLRWKLGMSPSYKAANNICVLMRPHMMLRNNGITTAPIDMFRKEVPYEVWEVGIVL